MKTKISITLGLLALAISAVPAAFGQCGMPPKLAKPAAWHPQFGAPSQTSAPKLLRAAYDDPFFREDGKSMVGMWHVVFTANKAGGETIPATVIDNALAVWHADRTEIMNSVRPPQDGNFCLGVWEQLDHSDYYLNHFPWYSNEFPNADPAGIGTAVGPTQIQEWVKLGSDGDHFTGTFQLDAYDLNNNILASFTGTLSGTRVTTKTKEKDLVN
jgi:hypothetical protein